MDAKRKFIGVALTLVVAGLSWSGPSVASAHDHGGPDGPPRTVTVGKGRFAKIADAVSSGRLDQAVVDSLRADGTVQALVSVDDDTVSDTAVATTAASADHDVKIIDDMRTEYGSRKRRARARRTDVVEVQDFDNLPISQVQISSVKSLLDLINDPDVSAIRANQTAEIGSMDPESAALVRQPAAAAAGYQGNGTYVAVLDTGVDYTRSDFGSCTAPNTPSTCRVPIAYDIAADDGSLDDDGHGTNVAGIVAGIAPGTKIIGLDVFAGGSAATADLLKAMNKLIELRRAGYNIVAVNMSIWSRNVVSAGACADTLGFASARAAGIIPVVIAGNGGSTSGISWPGCIPGALTVGAVYDSNVGAQRWNDGACTDATTAADQVTCFSQSGPTLKMLAPGSVITAAGISESGTSQAAPHVAGAVAVLAAAKPAAGVNAWESALVNSGPTIVDRDGRQRHRLDVVSSLQTLFGSADTTAPVVVAPSQSFTLHGTAETTGVPVTINWSATDASGISSSSLISSTNGAAWATETVAAGATSKAFLLAPGSTYQFAVAAMDGAGNWSSWAFGPSFTVGNFAENSSYVSYSAGWTRLAWAPAYGGFVTSSSTTNAAVSFTFTGRSAAWVASTASNRGVANVYVDNVYAGQWNLNSAATVARNVVLTMNWTSSGTHTVKLVVAGTAGHPTIDVDSFLLLG